MSLKLVIFLIVEFGSLIFVPFGLAQTASSSATKPDSLRVTLEHGIFQWQRLRYIANLRISLLDENGNMVPADQDYKIPIDIEARDASLWLDSDNDGVYERSDVYLVLTKGSDQVVGQIRWRISEKVKVQVSHGGLDVVATSETSPTFPILIFIICATGGALGGLLRRTINPKSELDLPLNILPKEISQKFLYAEYSFTCLS